MSTTMRNVSVGLFVLAALIALGWMIVMFGGAPRVLSDTYTVQMTFPTVGTVGDGAVVTLNGVAVGNVSRIEPQDHFRGGVQVRADIKSRFSIPRRSRAVIRPVSMGLAAAGIQIEVLPDPGDEMLPRDGTAVLPGVIEPDALTQTAQAINRLLEPRPTAQVDAAADRPDLEPVMPNLTTVLERLDQTLRGVHTLAEMHGEDVSAMIVNLRDASAHVRQLTATLEQFSVKAVAVADRADAAIGTAETALKSADAMFQSADRTMQTANAQVERVGTALVDNTRQLAAALDTLDRTLNQVAEGQGSLGRLVHDPALYDNMVIASDRLRETLTALQRLVAKWEAEGVAIKLR